MPILQHVVNPRDPRELYSQVTSAKLPEVARVWRRCQVSESTEEEKKLEGTNAPGLEPFPIGQSSIRICHVRCSQSGRGRCRVRAEMSELVKFCVCAVPHRAEALGRFWRQDGDA